MNSLVVYDSQFGNTRKVAETIGEELASHGGVRVIGVEQAITESLDKIDLLVVGGPTQAHGVSPRMRSYLATLAKVAPTGLLVAAFDTRLKGPGFLWGSAARAIADRLLDAGFELVAPPMSFFVEGMKVPRLADGEVERVRTWAAEIGALAAAGRLAAV